MENPMSNETAFEVDKTDVIDHATETPSDAREEPAIAIVTPAEKDRAFRPWRRASAPQTGPVPTQAAQEAASTGHVDETVVREPEEPTDETKVLVIDDHAAPPATPSHETPVEVAPAAPLAVLDAVAISAWFGERKVLDRVSLTMEAGKITALIGPSGCGKSTFLRILNRMHEMIPSASLAGEVLLDGEDVYGPSRRLTDARRNIGMVFQKPNPFPAMSIYDNVIAGLKLTGVNASRDTKDYLVESSLTKAGLWKEVRDRLRQPGGGLSGGQQQRLCIARSLAIKPRVLLMDEPCSALDPTSTRVIEETMLELAKEVTIVIVTHNMQQAQRVSDNCAFFLAAQGTPGNIVEQGDTGVMFDSPTDSRTFDYVNGRFG
jgi:phosphate transport system ATP-binding protein